MPSEHEKETAFLRQCIRYDASTAGKQLDERIRQVQRDERCLRRGLRLITLAAVLATAGIAYGAILLDDFPTRLSVFTSLFVIKLFCAVGIGSLICMVAFTGVGVLYRRELNQRRDECRRRVTKLLETRLGEPQAEHHIGQLKDHESLSEATAPRDRFAAAPPDAVTLAKTK